MVLCCKYEQNRLKYYTSNCTSVYLSTNNVLGISEFCLCVDDIYTERDCVSDLFSPLFSFYVGKKTGNFFVKFLDISSIFYRKPTNTCRDVCTCHAFSCSEFYYID